jgi:CRISPR-associated protein Cas9/Csn1, subtype II/NMEMI
MSQNSVKTILGLDLGVSSIGWALIESENDRPKAIKGMGVRIIPLSKDDQTEFTQGNAISKNQYRTSKRTQRRGFDRYQLRRRALIKVLNETHMMPDKHLLLELSPLEIWGIRAKAVTEKVPLQELGRILLHLNQKRGYKHIKTENTDSKEQTDYVQAVNDRYSYIKARGLTIGQHFFQELQRYFASEQKTDTAFRIKEKVFPREAYIEEFDKIWATQQKEYPSILTDNLHDTIRNEIIYYQRKLKSQKGLVKTCQFETRAYEKDGKKIYAGPKVAPRSSPLFQVEKLWESINNITIKNRRGDFLKITLEQKKEIFKFLDSNDKLTQSELYQILNIGRKDGFFTNDLIRKKGIQGNLTKSTFVKILGPEHPALKFDLQITATKHVDVETGELKEIPVIKESFEKEPLFKLWHIIYSLEENDCRNKLQKEFGFDENTVAKLASVDFTKAGFGNKSTRAIRKILPHLQMGLTYDKACEKAGYNHSNYLTKEDNQKRKLDKEIPLLLKNSLNQPVVEKILNQLINLVNTIISRYENPYEIRIELARELKQSREERNDAYNNINKRERENDKIRKLLLEHPEFRKRSVSKRDIDRYRLWEEFGKVSPYDPSKCIGIGELFSGDYEIEHIIPKSLRFDDSFSNKTLCHRKFNSGDNAKNNFTAYDYMSSKRSNNDFQSFLTCIEKAFNEKRISKTKYENLLRKSIDIPSDFINRQLNETRYISRKATEILSKVCRHIYTSTGSITQRLRYLWGWDEILEKINLPKYKSIGLIEEVEIVQANKTRTIERIKNWNKRDDHRHHAIDALTVACTRQGFIQRINSLNAQKNREEMRQEIGVYNNKLSLLDNYLLQFKPFQTFEIVKQIEAINISFKPGKKVATYSVRKSNRGKNREIVQKNIIEPRGPLSEESVYGKIYKKITRTIKLDKNFTQVDNIIDEKLKRLVKSRLAENDWKPEKAFGNLKKSPIWLDPNNKIPITKVDIIDFEHKYVIRYPVTSITSKDVEFVVDKKCRELLAERLKLHNNNHKEAFKDITNNRIWLNEKKKIHIRNVRCYTNIGSDSITPVKVFDKGWDIEYEKYLKPGNNHHIAIYRDTTGKLHEHVVTFWHAVERKKYGLPVIIKQPATIWDDILNNRELPQTFLTKLPLEKWHYVTSMQQNECFVFNMSKEELKAAIQKKEYTVIAPNIFRVRKLTKGSYWFNQQFETTPRENLEDKKAGRCIQASLSSMTGVKIKVNILGEIFLDE